MAPQIRHGEGLFLLLWNRRSDPNVARGILERVGLPSAEASNYADNFETASSEREGRQFYDFLLNALEGHGFDVRSRWDSARIELSAEEYALLWNDGQPSFSPNALSILVDNGLPFVAAFDALRLLDETKRSANPRREFDEIIEQLTGDAPRAGASDPESEEERSLKERIWDARDGGLQDIAHLIEQMGFSRDDAFDFAQRIRSEVKGFNQREKFEAIFAEMEEAVRESGRRPAQDSGSAPPPAPSPAAHDPLFSMPAEDLRRATPNPPRAETPRGNPHRSQGSFETLEEVERGGSAEDIPELANIEQVTLAFFDYTRRGSPRDARSYARIQQVSSRFSVHGPGYEGREMRGYRSPLPIKLPRSILRGASLRLTLLEAGYHIADIAPSGELPTFEHASEEEREFTIDHDAYAVFVIPEGVLTRHASDPIDIEVHFRVKRPDGDIHSPDGWVDNTPVTCTHKVRGDGNLLIHNTATTTAMLKIPNVLVAGCRELTLELDFPDHKVFQFQCGNSGDARPHIGEKSIEVAMPVSALTHPWKLIVLLTESSSDTPATPEEAERTGHEDAQIADADGDAEDAAREAVDTAGESGMPAETPSHYHDQEVNEALAHYKTVLGTINTMVHTWPHKHDPGWIRKRDRIVAVSKACKVEIERYLKEDEQVNLGDVLQGIVSTQDHIAQFLRTTFVSHAQALGAAKIAGDHERQKKLESAMERIRLADKHVAHSHARLRESFARRYPDLEIKPYENEVED